MKWCNKIPLFVFLAALCKLKVLRQCGFEVNKNIPMANIINDKYQNVFDP